MEYRVEKFIDGEWHYEGEGNVDYVNRIIKIFSEIHILIRIKEV